MNYARFVFEDKKKEVEGEGNLVYFVDEAFLPSLGTSNLREVRKAADYGIKGKLCFKNRSG